ncbi:MAG: DUF342 domain-containing protein [Ruminococcaceae bacterium]|nr:DUF342 domain-containing protein [Oscillospiraceae bacterium]
MAEKAEKKPKPKKKLFGLFGAKRQEDDAPEAAEAVLDAENTQDAGQPAGATVPKEDPTLNIMPAGESELYKMYCRIKGVPPLPDDAVFDVTQFHMQGLAPNEETREILKKLDRQAETMMRKWLDADAEPVDAEVVLSISHDKMRAYLFIFPPMFGADDVTEEQLRATLAEKGVEHGLDEEILAAAAKHTMLLMLVATGTPVQDGLDGSIVDHYNRDNDIHLTVKWDNTIDYRDLGWLQVARENDTICTIIPPTDAVSGTTVFGKEVKGKNGRKATVPKGTNTALNEEGNLLLSKIDGVVTFQADRFRVDPMLIIEGNVDIAVGNLDVMGDVLIKGDVQEGFTVTASGNVTVNGGVEGAHIQAGGNVQIGLGMNGNTFGTIKAGHDVFSKFFENTNVWAGGSITCDTIINSVIASEGEVLVRTGRGTIIGGQITALLRVAAISIGNPSNRAMEITLGNTAAWLQEKKETEDARAAVLREIDELEKSIRFLQRQIDTPQKKEQLDKMTLQLRMNRLKLGKLDTTYGTILAREADIVKCRLQAEVVYPPLQVTMGNALKMIRKNHYNVLMYHKDGEIHVANV